MLNALSAIKWCVCTTMELVGDICSRTRAHFMKVLVIARTMMRRLNVLVQTLWQNSILTRMKISTSNGQSALTPTAHEFV